MTEKNASLSLRASDAGYQKAVNLRVWEHVQLQVKNVKGIPPSEGRGLG
jgi:hypothetical protein